MWNGLRPSDRGPDLDNVEEVVFSSELMEWVALLAQQSMVCPPYISVREMNKNIEKELDKLMFPEGNVE